MTKLTELTIARLTHLPPPTSLQFESSVTGEFKLSGLADPAQKTTSPILLLHATNDMDIPHAHSASLFYSLKDAAQQDHFHQVTYEGWGTVRSFDRPGGAEVVWLEGDAGGHNEIGQAEGSIDLIARVAHL
jgi:hypothetical protein